MRWTKKQFFNHLRAAKLLSKIKDAALLCIKRNPTLTEYEVQEFVFNQFAKYHLKTDGKAQIVAFDAHAAIPHYFPAKKSAQLKPNTLILLDIWARLNKKNAPFADITWMAYHGAKVPKEMLRAFTTVIRARDACIRFLRSQLKSDKIPTGKEVDRIARDIIHRAGYYGKFIHGTGHPLGLTTPHGRGSRINRRGRIPLRKSLGYTIEPGIYLKNKFGIRSEIDFFIDKRGKLLITTETQKRILKI